MPTTPAASVNESDGDGDGNGNESGGGGGSQATYRRPGPAGSRDTTAGWRAGARLG